MSSTELTFDLYKWLSDLQIITGNHRYKTSGNFELEPKTAQSLLSGFALGKLVIIIGQEKGISINETLLGSIKNSNTPAGRTYNWNVLQQAFIKVGISLSKQTQKQISAGNFATLVAFLKKVKSDIIPKKLQKDKKNLADKDADFDLKKIKTIQNYEAAQSVLQLILFLISQDFGLTAKQALSTLSQNGKYFAHMVVKGIKGSHSDIVKFYEQLKELMPSVLFLCEKSPEKNTEFLLQILKPSLISRDVDVTKAGCLALQSFIEESLKYNSKNLVYQILCKDNVGFDFIYMGIKRHPSLIGQIFGFLYPLIRFCCRDFFQIQFKISINSQQEYLMSIITLLPAMLLHQEAKAMLLESKTTELWIQNCKQSLNASIRTKNRQHVEQIKLLYLELLCELWKAYSKQLQSNENEQLLMKVIEQLKKNTRKQAYIIKITALYRLFDFLDYLALMKNKLAALIYKKIIFLFIENHEDTEIRQIILQNFILSLKKFPTIPLQFLLQPFLKQLNAKEGTSYIMNLYDIQFVIEVCRHPKMQISFALSFLDYFSKLYIKSIIFSSMIFRIMEIITDRFCQYESIIDYCLKNTDQYLNLYGMLVLGKKKQPKEELIINNQKKSLIIQLIKHYVALEHGDLSEGIKNRVLKIYIGWAEDRNYRDRGLESILMLYGSVDEIVLQYKLVESQSKRASGLDSYAAEDYSPTVVSSVRVKGTPLRLNKKVESNISLIHLEKLEKSDDFFKQHNFGYKKKYPSKQQRLNFLLNRNDFKPDPKVLEDIERIKAKVKEDEIRKKVHREVEERRVKDKYKVNSEQLLQRNLSLGYTKLPQLSQNKILFDFDSVKTKHLKEDHEHIDLEMEEDREETSASHILSKYGKYTKWIFNKYAYASMADKRTVTIGDKSLIALSFTEIVRMLKDKGMNRVPKMVINQIMAKINYEKRKERNLLGGIFEEDFDKFLIQLTHVLNIYQKNSKDLPFGLYLQRTIRSLIQGQSLSKQLKDPKIAEYKHLFGINSSQSKNQTDGSMDISIPQGYKKTKEKDMMLDYGLLLADSRIDQTVLDCFEVVDWIFQKAIGSHLLCPCIEIVEVETIVQVQRAPKIKKLMPQSTQKNVRALQADLDQQQHQPGTGRKKQAFSKKSVSQKQFQSSVSKTIDPVMLQEQKQKQRIRVQHNQKIKMDLQKLREEKIEKEKEVKKKREEDEDKARKKEQTRKKYLEENKRKIKEKNDKEQQSKEQEGKKEEIRKEEGKMRIKKKEAELLQQQKKRIRDAIDKRNEKVKQKQSKELSANKTSSPTLANKVLQKLSATKDEKKKDHDLKKSIDSGDIKLVLDKYEKQFYQLFQAYWHWQKQKIQLNSLALMLRDFNISPQYIIPKHIAEVYKAVGKGQPLQCMTFIQAIARLAYRSDKLIDTAKDNINKQKKTENTTENNEYDPQVVAEICKKLKMDQQNYKSIVKATKENRL